MTMLRRRDLALLAAWAKPLGLMVGCQTRSYMAPNRDGAKLKAMLDDIAAAGFAGVETNYISVERSFADPAPMIAEFGRRKLSLIGLHMGIPWNNASRMEAALAVFETVVQGVTALKGTHVVISGEASGDALKRKCETLEKLSRRTREAGIRLAVHNHTEEALEDWKEFRYLLAHTGKDVWLLVDAGHAIMARQDPWLLLREHGGRIAGIHLRDRLPEKPVLMGQGQLNLADLGRAVKDARWNGWLIVELEGYPMEGVSPEQGVREARRLIRRDVGV